jgi:hypothetical protein
VIEPSTQTFFTTDLDINIPESAPYGFQRLYLKFGIHPIQSLYSKNFEKARCISHLKKRRPSNEDKEKLGKAAEVELKKLSCQ